MPDALFLCSLSQCDAWLVHRDGELLLELTWATPENGVSLSFDDLKTLQAVASEKTEEIEKAAKS